MGLLQLKTTHHLPSLPANLVVTLELSSSIAPTVPQKLVDHSKNNLTINEGR